MSNAYQFVTKNQEEKKETLVEPNAIAVQEHFNWLASDSTKRMMLSLKKQSDSLVTDAIGLALVNHQSDNSKQIVHKLIEANTLRKVVETYAK